MRIIFLATLLLATPAIAQKADRHPDPDLDGPKVVRVIPITPSFDQRWFGPPQSDHWISHKPPPSDRFTPGVAYRLVDPQNVSTALPAAVGIVPVPGNRLRHDPIRSQQASIRKPDQATCLRHNLRTVWSGQSWRCRK